MARRRRTHSAARGGGSCDRLLPPSFSGNACDLLETCQVSPPAQAIFRSDGKSDKAREMTALTALQNSPPTLLSAAVRYYRNAVETG